MLMKHLFLIPTSDTETSLSSSFPKDKHFPSSKLEGSLLIPQEWEGAVRGFSTAFLAPSANREKRRWGTIPVSLTQDSEVLFSSSWLDPFPEPCSDSSYGNGRQSLWRSRRGKGRHGSTSCLEWWGLCSAQAGELVGSSAWKVQLKEATPVLSKRERNSTASFGLPEQQRQQRNHSLDYGTQTVFGNSHIWERGDSPADLLGKWGWSWQFGWNQEHNKMQKKGLKLGIPLLAPLTASQEQGCSVSHSKWNSGPFPPSEWPRKR